MDNTIKVPCDALTHAKVWKDDSQIDDLRIVRRGVVPDGKMVISITELD